MPEVDERVASLVFDNSEFDPEVKKSQKTLEEFEKSLDPKAFDKYAKNLNSQDFKPLNNSLSALGNTFKSLETIATGALLNIGMKLENTLSSGIRKMTIDPMIQGWTAYGEKVTSVQTIMAATRNKFVEFADAVDRGDESVQNFIASQDALVTGAQIMENQMAYVNEQLDQLMAFTDETSASYGVMVNNIGKFTSQNIDLQTSVKAMEGIATWANLSGANAEQMARAMYNISQSLGVGKMMTRDWMSIENANMATVEFKQAAIDTAVELGVLKRNADGVAETLDGKTKVAVNNFRDTLSGDWFTGDVMMGALDKYGRFAQEIVRTYQETGVTVRDIMDAVDDISESDNATEAIEEFITETELAGKEADILRESLKKLSSAEYDLGKRAFRAAYESKTFADAVGYVGDAIRTGWIKSYELIVGDYEEARKFWTEVAEVLYTLFVEIGEVRNEILTVWKASGGRNELMEALKNIRDFFLGKKGEPGLLDIFKQIVGEFFPQLKSDTSTVSFFARVLLSITKSFKNFSENLRKNPEVIAKITKVIRIVVRVLKFAWEIIKGIATFFGPTIRWTKDLFKSFSKLIDPISDGAEGTMDFIEGLKSLRAVFLVLGAAIALPIKLLSNFINWLDKVGNMTLPELEKAVGDWLTNIWTSITGFVISMWTLGKNVVDGFSNGFKDGWDAVEKFIGGLFTGLIDIVKNILGIHSPSTVFIAIGTMLLGGLIVGIAKMEGPLGETLKSVFSILQGFAVSVLSLIARVLIAIAIVKLIKKISTIAMALPNMFEGIATFFTKAGKSLVIMAKQHYKSEIIRSIGQSALMIAGAIAIVGALVITINKLGLTWDDFGKAAAMVGLIAAGFIVIMAAFALMQKFLATGEVGETLTVGGELLKKIGIDAKRVSANSNNMSNGLKRMASAMIKIGIALGLVTYSIIGVVAIMKNTGTEWTDMWMAFGFTAAITAFVGLVISGLAAINKWLTKGKVNITEVTKSFIKLCAGLELLILGFVGVMAIIRLAKITDNDFVMADLILGTLITFSTLVLGLTAMFRNMKSSVTGDKTSLLFFKISGLLIGLLGAFAGVLAAMRKANISDSDLVMAEVMLGIMIRFSAAYLGLTGLMKTVMKSLNDKIIASFAAIMASAAVSIMLFTVAAKAISDADISWDVVLKLLVISAIVAAMASIFALIGGLLQKMEVGWQALLKITLIAGIVISAILVIAASFYIVSEALKVFAENFQEFSRVLKIWNSMEDHVALLWDFIGICAAIFAGSLFLALAAPSLVAFAGAWTTLMLAFLLTSKIIERASRAFYNAHLTITALAATFNASIDIFKTAAKNMKEVFTDDLKGPIQVLGLLGMALISIGIGGYVSSTAIYLLVGALSAVNMALEPLKNVMEFFKTITPDVTAGMTNLAMGLFMLGLVVTLTAPGILTLALSVVFLALAVLICGNNIDAVNNLIDLLLQRSTDLAVIISSVALGIAAMGAAFAVAGVGAIVLGLGLTVVAVATLALITNALLAVGVLFLFDLLLNKIKEDNPELYDSIMKVITAVSNFMVVLELLMEMSLPIFQELIPIAIDIIRLTYKIIKTVISGIFNWFKDKWEKFRSFWEAYVEPVIGWVTNLFDTIYNKVKDKVSEFFELGKNIIGGIAKGLEDSGEKRNLFQKIGDVVGNVIKAFKGDLKIESPSKVMADVSKWIPAGVSEGIKNNAVIATRAMREMSRQMEDEFRDYNGIHSRSALYYKAGSEIPHGVADATKDGTEAVTDATKDMAEDALDAFEDEIQQKKKEYAARRAKTEVMEYKLEEDKTLGGALSNIWEDVKKIFNQVKEGKVTLGDGLKALLESLKVHGGAFLGEKLDSLKDMFFGEGGPLSGLADLLKNPFGDIGDIFKNLDPDKLTKTLEESLKNLDLSGTANNVPDMSGLGGAGVGAGQGRQEQFVFTQNNYSPKALSRLEIYRQTKRQFNEFRVREELAK